MRLLPEEESTLPLCGIGGLRVSSPGYIPSEGLRLVRRQGISLLRRCDWSGDGVCSHSDLHTLSSSWVPWGYVLGRLCVGTSVGRRPVFEADKRHHEIRSGPRGVETRKPGNPPYWGDWEIGAFSTALHKGICVDVRWLNILIRCFKEEHSRGNLD
eukprot:1195437-Prorocentrum_minimum.AAC.4